MIAPDSIPAWFAIPTAVVALVAWLVIEIRHAPADPNPNQLTGLDVLERTGHFPG